MRRLLHIVLLLAISRQAAWGQRIPRQLDTPATPDFEMEYEDVYHLHKTYRAATYTCLGVAAAGTFVMIHSMDSNNEGEGRFVPNFLAAFCLVGGSGGGLWCMGNDILLRQRLKNLRIRNDMTVHPWKTQEMVDYERASRRYQSSRTAMNVSATATGLLAGYAVVGSIAYSKSGDEFLGKSSEAAAWMVPAGALALLSSWLISRDAKNTMVELSPAGQEVSASVVPFVAPSPVKGDGAVLGLSLSARF